LGSKRSSITRRLAPGLGNAALGVHLRVGAVDTASPGGCTHHLLINLSQAALHLLLSKTGSASAHGTVVETPKRPTLIRQGAVVIERSRIALLALS
jgi:hypothetical protein